MKIINYGVHYEIYPDDLQTFDKLPAATYKVAFNPMSGFSLIRIDDFESIEEKIYGNHLEKITKVLRSYEKFNRSMGIMLSGNKGMGKSLFVQLLAKEAISKNLPVIIVNKPYKGVADFLEKISQEVLVVFDEFEKVFSIEGNDQGSVESQNDLLGLFDGTSQKKRLYAITVNNLHRVSEFMVSRTGRFHYHIRFDYPTAEEINVYLRDKIEEQYYSEIKHVIAFTNRVKLNYDSLRAIAFELNMGYGFKEAISDLNILTTDAQRYDVRVHFTNGKSIDLRGERLNLFAESIRINGYTEDSSWFNVEFSATSINTEPNGKMLIDGANVEFNKDEDFEDGIGVETVVISHHMDPSINYRLTV